jgi:hypothetical protein
MDHRQPRAAQLESPTASRLSPSPLITPIEHSIKVRLLIGIITSLRRMNHGVHGGLYCATTGGPAGRDCEISVSTGAPLSSPQGLRRRRDPRSAGRRRMGGSSYSLMDRSSGFGNATRESLHGITKRLTQPGLDPAGSASALAIIAPSVRFDSRCGHFNALTGWNVLGLELYLASSFAPLSHRQAIGKRRSGKRAFAVLA